MTKFSNFIIQQPVIRVKIHYQKISFLSTDPAHAESRPTHADAAGQSKGFAAANKAKAVPPPLRPPTRA